MIAAWHSLEQAQKETLVHTQCEGQAMTVLSGACLAVLGATVVTT